MGTATNAIQGAVNAAPDRSALAQSTLQNLISSTDPAYQQSLRQVGEDAAKYGRIGAGMTTTQLDDLTLARQKSLDAQASQLSADAAGQTQQDRLNAAQAALSGYNSLSGQRIAQQQADTSRTGVGNQFTLGQGQLALGGQQLGEQTREATANESLANLTADRNFLLNPDAAAAMAVKDNGTNFANLGPGTTYTPGADIAGPALGKIDTSPVAGVQTALGSLAQPGAGAGAIGTATGQLSAPGSGTGALRTAIGGLQGANPNQAAIDAAKNSLTGLAGQPPLVGQGSPPAQPPQGPSVGGSGTVSPMSGSGTASQYGAIGGLPGAGLQVGGLPGGAAATAPPGSWLAQAAKANPALLQGITTANPALRFNSAPAVY